jgi:hypothetical protein
VLIILLTWPINLRPFLISDRLVISLFDLQFSGNFIDHRTRKWHLTKFYRVTLLRRSSVTEHSLVPSDTCQTVGLFSGKEKAARRRLVLVISSCLFLDGVSGIPRCILHIAHGVVGGSLGLIKLAFGFHVLVTTEFTGTFFDGAFWPFPQRPLRVRDP